MRGTLQRYKGTARDLIAILGMDRLAPETELTVAPCS